MRGGWKCAGEGPEEWNVGDACEVGEPNALISDEVEGEVGGDSPAEGFEEKRVFVPA